ncbi:MAG: pseudouridine synthase, partial [Oscillospiraceae bacterium]
MERLDKLLANTGKWSRKEAKDLLKQGRVTVDGTLAARPEDKCGETAVIAVDGTPISHSANTYIMLHKPAGILSATEDRKQKTVLDLLTEPLQKQGLFPVGRLDKDTEGLLLLTNDGPLAHRLLAPKSHVDKVYFTRVAGTLT